MYHHNIFPFACHSLYLFIIIITYYLTKINPYDIIYSRLKA
nr:MAG TPA_asm: hypothetical protein [Caudoviricetes sp.]